MKIGVVGGGTVGHATARCFMEHGEVRVYDTVPERRTHSLTEVTSCDLVFVCLPTPPVKSNATSTGCDLSYIEDFFEWHRGFKANFVLRSTVPIGTTRRLAEKYDLPNLVHSPEFLTARCAVTDAQIPARNIVGYPGWNFRTGLDADGYLKEFDQPHEQCFRTLLQLYQKRFPGVPIHVMKSDESEAVKLFQNGFFAVKVAYFNEINSLATKLGLNWETVVSAILADGRIAHSHTKVPGPDGKYGYGGECLIPSTPVCTPSGWSPIEELQVGDEVCTHLGNTKITEVAEVLPERVLTVRARGYEVTGSAQHLHVQVVKDKFLKEKPLGQFCPGEWIFLPWQPPPHKQAIVQMPSAIPYAKIWHDSVEWSPDLAWAIGLWLAEGCAGKWKQSADRPLACKVQWSLGEHEEEMADRLCRILSDYGLNAHKRLSVSTGSAFGESRTWAIKVSQSWFYYFLKTIGVLGDCYTKRAPMTCPYDESLIGGWLDGDGSLTNGTISAHSESTDMIRDFSRLFWSLKVPVQRSNDGKKLKVSTRTDIERVSAWTTRLIFDPSRYKRDASNASPTMRYMDGGVCAQIQDISLSEVVPLIGIETENGFYIANGQLTHNCLPKDLDNLRGCFQDAGVVETICSAAKLRNEHHDLERNK